MKHIILLALISFTLFTSCASKKWVDVSDQVNIELIMHDKFPKLYNYYKSGELIVRKVELLEENGKQQYRVTYKERNDDEDMTDWLTIYMPMLNN